MPVDIYTVNRTKDLIVSFIRARGPSLPVHIARDVKVSPLFAAAFLSELYGEGKVKMSGLKVGSSPLYYLADQISQLENFTEHLNIREKEAYTYLKQEKILDDEKLEPVLRVALRAIKDFALPVRFTQNNQPRLFWRHFLFSEEEAQQRIASLLEPASKKEAKETIPQKTIEEAKTSQATTEPSAEIPVQKPLQPRTPRPKRSPTPLAPMPIVTLPLPQSAHGKQEKKIDNSLFTQSVREHLAKREIRVLEVKEESKKGFSAKIVVDTLFGPQHFFLVAKDKKRLKAEELIEALREAHAEKMPALVLAPGELEKKAQRVLAEWSALIKFEKLG